MPQRSSRQHFQDELAKLEAQALGGLDLVAEALDRALETVAHRDIELASMVVADDDRVDGRYLEVHQGILSLLALQAPVAGDLRLVAALLHVIKHVERMGDQCVNMAKLVPLAGHEPPDDVEMLANIARMGELAGSLVVQAKQSFERRDAALAQDLVRQDDEIDQLNRRCFSPCAGHRRRPRHPRVGDAHDPRRPLPGARRRQRGGHRRADRVRGHRAVPRVRGRLAPRARPPPLTWPPCRSTPIRRASSTCSPKVAATPRRPPRCWTG
ncbi:MAG: PhoU domain-containing protein [Thermoleophilaceae bacterium]